MKQKPEIYLILQNIRSLFNVGALFRCADAFGVSKIFLCGYTGYPPRKEISKTALGAENTIPWEKHWHTHLLIKKLKEQGIRIVSLEITDDAQNLSTFRPQYPLALIVGNEVKGVSKKILELSDQKVFIPMHGIKESLNVGVAGGIALYQIKNYTK